MSTPSFGWRADNLPAASKTRSQMAEPHTGVNRRAEMVQERTARPVAAGAVRPELSRSTRGDLHEHDDTEFSWLAALNSSCVRYSEQACKPIFKPNIFDYLMISTYWGDFYLS